MDNIKVNILKGFFTNPVSWVAGLITLGSFVFAWGVKSANKTNDIIVLKEDVNEIKTIVTPLKSQNDSLKHQLYYINKKIEKIDGTTDMLKTQLGNHIIKTSKDKQDILNWFNATEEKKNNSSYLTR